MKVWPVPLVISLMAPAAIQAQVGACFDSQVGDWKPVPTEEDVRSMALPSNSGDSLAYAFPPRIRFESDGRFSIPEGALPTVHQTLSWTLEEGRISFYLDWESGYVGLHGELGRDGDLWRGYARSRTHQYGLQRYEHDLTLVPADCSSPPPVPAESDRVLPLSVTLDDGRVWAVGASPPVTSSDGAIQIDLTSTSVVGDYRGATAVVARVVSGQIESLGIDIDASVLDSLVERIFDPADRYERMGYLRSNRSGRIYHPPDTHHIVVRAQPGRLRSRF